MTAAIAFIRVGDLVSEPGRYFSVVVALVKTCGTPLLDAIMSPTVG